MTSCVHPPTIRPAGSSCKDSLSNLPLTALWGNASVSTQTSRRRIYIAGCSAGVSTTVAQWECPWSRRQAALDWGLPHCSVVVLLPPICIPPIQTQNTCICGPRSPDGGRRPAITSVSLAERLLGLLRPFRLTGPSVSQIDPVIPNDVIRVCGLGSHTSVLLVGLWEYICASLFSRHS